ncbi:MAG: ATP-binding protein [Chloroflexota bacterium]
MNWKLSGALLLIVVVSVGLMYYLSNLSTAREFQQYVARGNTAFAQVLADEAGTTYSGSLRWSDVQNTMLSRLRSPDERIVVADASGNVVVDTGGDWLGRSAAQTGLSNGTPVTANSRLVGQLYLMSITTGPMGMGRGQMMGRNIHTTMMPTAEEDFLHQVNASLWQAGLIAAVIALLAGLLLTRQITRPVRALMTGARHIARGDLAHRVPVTSRDELGELADSFNAMASSLEKVEQSRRQLTADIAHELRTPLTVIEGTVDGILDGVFQPDKERLYSIKEQATLLARLTGDLRDLSLAESGQLNLDLAATDIVALVRRVVARQEVTAAAKRVSLQMSAPGAVPEAVVDPARLEQVITNLLTNAIRHTPEGGGITVTVAGSREEIEIAVADTGEGIRPEDLPHVFERFYRAGSSRSRREGGSGLGLAIVKQMVAAHGGQVRAESRPGRGSTFRVTLPLIPPKLPRA